MTESNKRVTVAQHCIETSWAERNIALKKAAIEERANAEIASHRVETEKEVASLKALEEKIASAERMGLQEEVVGLKRKHRAAIMS